MFDFDYNMMVAANSNIASLFDNRWKIERWQKNGDKSPSTIWIPRELLPVAHKTRTETFAVCFVGKLVSH